MHACEVPTVGAQAAFHATSLASVGDRDAIVTS
jgi:hypothetical protein